MYDIGLRIKKTRVQRGITQKKLAERISRSVQAISSYERNAQIPPTEVLTSIAMALNVPVDYLLGADYREEPVLFLAHLSEEKRALVESIYEELMCLDERTEILSARQMELINKLTLCFAKKS